MTEPLSEDLPFEEALRSMRLRQDQSDRQRRIPMQE